MTNTDSKSVSQDDDLEKHSLVSENFAKRLDILHEKFGMSPPSYRMAKQIVWKKLKKKLLSINWVKKVNEQDLTLELETQTPQLITFIATLMAIQSTTE